MKLLPLWKAEHLADGRYGIFLSSRELKAQDSDSREEELIFCVVRPPYFGYLENIATGQEEFCFHPYWSWIWDEKKPSPSLCCLQAVSCHSASPKWSSTKELLYISSIWIGSLSQTASSSECLVLWATWGLLTCKKQHTLCLVSFIFLKWYLESTVYPSLCFHLFFADLNSGGPVLSSLSLSPLHVRSREQSHWTSFERGT